MILKYRLRQYGKLYTSWRKKAAQGLRRQWEVEHDESISVEFRWFEEIN